jgi:O-antigen ligase
MKRFSILDNLLEWLWGLTLFVLPITSFRYFPSFMGDSMVRPMSLYPMALLFPILIYLFFKRGWYKKLPVELIPFLGFLIFLVISTLLGFFKMPLELRGQDYWGRALRAWVTVGFGMAFFFSTIWMNRTPEDLRRSLKWLYGGLILNFIWGAIQLLAMKWFLPFDLLQNYQNYFSVAGMDAKRINGFSLEPSWLAADMVTIYLPWLCASIFTGYRATRRWWVEPVLTGMAFFLLIFSYSRSGIINVLICAALVFLLTGRELLKKWGAWLFRPQMQASDPPRIRLRVWAARVGVVLIGITGLACLGYILSRNPYFAQLWRAQRSDLLQYFIDIYAGSRLAFAWASVNVFLAHPWTGVGLGASGLYIFSHLPDWSITYLAEVADLLSPASHQIPNPKNFLIRILAESGIMGFSFFMAFYLSILGKIRVYLSNSFPARFVGIAGLFIWIIVLLIYFTQDSFAMPNMWIGLGLILGLSQHWGEEKAT